MTIARRLGLGVAGLCAAACASAQPPRPAGAIALCPREPTAVTVAGVEGLVYHPCQVDVLPSPDSTNQPPKFSELLRGAGILQGSARAAFVVDTAGRVAVVLGAHGEPHDVIAATLRDALRSWRFTPARRGGRLVPFRDSVEYEGTAADASPPPILAACFDCDEELFQLRRRVLRHEKAVARCATALRELARTQPTDTLPWAVENVRGCAGEVEAAALALRLTGQGYVADSLALFPRARLARRYRSALILEAAERVATDPLTSVEARLQAFRVLGVLANPAGSRTPEDPDAVGWDHRAGRPAGGCGPLLVVGGIAVATAAPLPDDSRARIAALAERVLGDASSPSAVRAAAFCLREAAR